MGNPTIIRWSFPRVLLFYRELLFIQLNTDSSLSYFMYITGSPPAAILQRRGDPAVHKTCAEKIISGKRSAEGIEFSAGGIRLRRPLRMSKHNSGKFLYI